MLLQIQGLKLGESSLQFDLFRDTRWDIYCRGKGSKRVEYGAIAILWHVLKLTLVKLRGTPVGALTVSHNNN